jgi:hypothetical protein
MFTRHGLGPANRLDCPHAMGTNAFSALGFRMLGCERRPWCRPLRGLRLGVWGLTPDLRPGLLSAVPAGTWFLFVGAYPGNPGTDGTFRFLTRGVQGCDPILLGRWTAGGGSPYMSTVLTVEQQVPPLRRRVRSGSGRNDKRGAGPAFAGR